MRRKSSLAFTLMELMIAVAIMMILSAVSLGSFWQSQKKSRDTQRKSDLGQIGRALEMFNEDFFQYPESDGGNMLGCQTEADGAFVACTVGREFAAYPGGVKQIYMKKFPGDPQGGDNYYYTEEGSGFALYSVLENTQDASYHATGWDASGTGSGDECGGEVCRYKLVDYGVIYPE